MTEIPIIAGVATIPSREATFRRMLASIADQVDQLHVYLSGYVGYLTGLPGYDCCHQHKLTGDPYGDAGKFIGLDDAYGFDRKGSQEPGYYLTLDDDLLYPPNYVETIVKGIEHYGRKVVVSFHGRNFGHFPIQSYYRSAVRRYYCLRRVAQGVVIQVPGTGCLGFHTSTMKLSMEDFPSKNMADVHMAVALRRQGTRAICLKHAAGWIEHLPVNHGSSIYNLRKDDCREQTRRINEAFG